MCVFVKACKNETIVYASVYGFRWKKIHTNLGGEITKEKTIEGVKPEDLISRGYSLIGGCTADLQTA